MVKHIGAALIASVVFFIAVSPAAAKPQMNPGSIEPLTGIIRSFENESEIAVPTPQPENNPLTPSQKASLDAFKHVVTTGDPALVTGLFVPDHGGFYVVQQASGQDGMVSPAADVLTQFRRPAANGVIGLLAHNFAAGKWFDELETGDLLYLIHGDGTYDVYRLSEKMQFKAINGKSVLTDFIDLATGEVRNVDEVYNQVYAGKPHLTLQTCIQQDKDLDWGRLFLLAEQIP